MANKNAKKQISPSNPYQQISWANITLPDDASDQIEAEAGKPASLVKELAVLIGMGYNFTCKYDVRSECIQATFICANPDLPNSGMGLSAWADDLPLAVAALLYKHYVAANGLWQATPQKAKNKFR